MQLAQQVKGCLLGGALGDARGGPFEGSKGPVSFEIPKHPCLSDDTQLTLATCEAILTAGRAEPESIARNFGVWYRQRRIRGAGSSTLKALTELSAGGHWALCGAKGEYSAGSGAAMRAAPLAFVLDPQIPEERRTIRDICRITHQNEEAYVGSLAIIVAIRSIIFGDWPSDGNLIDEIVPSLPDSSVRDRLLILKDRCEDPAAIAAEFGATGHVVDSVPLAIYSAQRIRESSIEVVISDAIRGGGDTDTTAAMAGQIAGCVTGVTPLPHSSLNSIAGIVEAKGIVEDFADFVSSL